MKIIDLDIESFSYNGGRSEIESLSGQRILMDKGEKLSIIGPSGCGKSTLLKIISGMVPLEKGKITVEGKISYILQEYGLFPWKKVYSNIELPLILENKNKEKKKRDIEVRMLAESLGIDNILNEYPHNISGGQRQRVAIARALITNPEILLMDEPFNALDSLTREEIQDMVMKIADERKMSTVLVTHNIEESVYMSDKVLIMGKRNEMLSIKRNSDDISEFRNSKMYYDQINMVRKKLKEISGGDGHEK